MDTGTIIRAIDNLPAAAREQLLGRIAGMVVEALADGQGAPRNGRPRRGANGAQRAEISGRATEEQVLEHIKANPDQRTEQISAALSADVKPALKKLRESKSIRTKGHRRAMTYSVR